MFRLLDDYGQHIATRSGNGLGPALATSMKSFQPRFDIKETKEAYELQGELPGVEQKDIEVEWQDANTLTIKGHVESRREEGTRPTGFVEGGQEPAEITSGEENGYHKASVEEEGAVSAAPSKQATEAPAAQESESEGPRYWLYERQSGNYARTFNFPGRVDQENVKASLKNGILSVIVPKAAAPVSKRINIE